MRINAEAVRDYIQATTTMEQLERIEAVTHAVADMALKECVRLEQEFTELQRDIMDVATKIQPQP